MKHAGILMLLYFLGCMPAVSQRLDSMKVKLLQPDLVDSARVDSWNELSFDYAGRDPEIGLMYADSALRLAEQMNDAGKIASSHNSFGVNYWYQGKDSLALFHYSQVLSHHQQTGNEAGQARAFNNMALLSYNKAAYLDALRYHTQANEIFRKLGMTQNLVNSLSNTGVVFLAINDYPRALEHFLDALTHTDSLLYYELGNLNTNIGLVYKNVQDVQLAVLHHEKALKYHERSGNLHLQAQAKGNLAAVYQEEGRFAEAEELLNQALELNESLGNPRRIASDLANLGVLYTGMGEIAKAIAFFRRSADLYKETQDHLNLSLTLHRWADAVLQERHKGKSRAVEAAALQSRSLQSALQANSLLHQMNAWHGLASSYRLLGRYSEALEAFEAYVALKDSVFSTETDKKLVRAQAAFELQQRERELDAAHQLEKSELEAMQRQDAFALKATIGVLLFFFVSFGLLAYSIYRRKEEEQARLRAEFQSKKTALELKALRAQMDPHFIFNALSSISNFLLHNDAVKADYYLTQFAKLTRHILESSDQSFVTLQDEVEVLRYYIEIESMRMAKPIHFQVVCAEDLDIATLLLPPMLLQPLVENAIWHGISKVDRAGLVELEVSRTQEGVYLQIRDNGGGIQSGPSIVQSALYKRSMGLQLVQSRLELISETNGSLKNEISWKQLPQGTEVAISIPVYG